MDYDPDLWSDSEIKMERVSYIEDAGDVELVFLGDDVEEVL